MDEDKVKNKYLRSISHTASDTAIEVDVYDVLDAFGPIPPPIQHAIKKLLCAGNRGIKGVAQDYQEAIVSIQRHLAKITPK